METKVEQFLDEQFVDTGIGVTLGFNIKDCDVTVLEWLQARRGMKVCNDKYVVSDRGGATYVGVRRKARYD